MKTLKERIKAAKELQARTFLTTTVYDVVCDLKDKLPIDRQRTIEEARVIIKGINEEYIRMDGRGIRLFIRPVVVDNDSYEPVTEENMQYYDLNSQFVKNLIQELNY
jgi:hypothetical protein